MQSSPALLKTLNFISNKTILSCEQGAQPAVQERECTEAQAGFGGIKAFRGQLFIFFSHTKCCGYLWLMTASENEVLLCIYKTDCQKGSQKCIRNVTSAGKNTFEVSEQGRK